MFLATCLATCHPEVKVEGVFLLADRTKHCETSCKRGITLCKRFKNPFTALPQSLRKVELHSTSCNACCNKNVARLDDCVDMLHRAIFCATCVATKLRDTIFCATCVATKLRDRVARKIAQFNISEANKFVPHEKLDKITMTG